MILKFHTFNCKTVETWLKSSVFVKRSDNLTDLSNKAKKITLFKFKFLKNYKKYYFQI